MARYRLNLDLSPRSVKFGSVQCFLNWANTPDGETEPALVFRKADGGRALAVMPMAYVTRVMGSDGWALLGMVSEAAFLAESIGFARGDRAATKNVADAILELTDDLFQMPGWPPAESVDKPVANAVMRMRHGDEVVNEFEVTV